MNIQQVSSPVLDILTHYVIDTFHDPQIEGGFFPFTSFSAEVVTTM